MTSYLIVSSCWIRCPMSGSLGISGAGSGCGCGIGSVNEADISKAARSGCICSACGGAGGDLGAGEGDLGDSDLGAGDGEFTRCLFIGRRCVSCRPNVERRESQPNVSPLIIESIQIQAETVRWSRVLSGLAVGERQLNMGCLSKIALSVHVSIVRIVGL